MENLQLEYSQLEKFEVTELNFEEATEVNGGYGFWGDVAFGVATFLSACYSMGQHAQGNPHI